MNLNISQILLLLFPIFVLILILILKKKSTRPILISILTLSILIEYCLFRYTNIMIFSNGKVLYVLSVILISILYIVDLVLCLKSILIYYGNYQIFSLSFIINLINNNKLKDKKILGSIIPFSPNTIKDGGKYIPFEEINSVGGTIVTGSTGSGKSYLIRQLIEQDMIKGKPIVYFDFKGEDKTYNDLKKIANKHGYDLYGNKYEEDMYFFDPLYCLSQNGRIEAILNARKWDVSAADAHYKLNTHSLIQKYVKEFDKILKKKENEGFEFDKYNFAYTKNLYLFITKNKPDMSNRDVANAYKTIVTLLELILMSDLGNTFNSKNDREFSFSEKNEYGDKYLLIISIPSDSKELVNSFSSFYLKAILSTGGIGSGFNPNLMLYIDEAASGNPYNYKDVLEKGRSFGINTILIMQDIYQMEIETNVAFTNSILGTVVNYFIFSGCTKDAAERIAGVQIKEITSALQNLSRPPKVTALFITKQPVIDKSKVSEVYKFRPYIVGQNNNPLLDLFNFVKDNENSQDNIDNSNHREKFSEYDESEENISIQDEDYSAKNDDYNFDDPDDVFRVHQEQKKAKKQAKDDEFNEINDFENLF